MLLILQDHKSKIVLELISWDIKKKEQLEVGEFIPLKKRKDLYIIKGILSNPADESYLLKVKVNKESDYYHAHSKYGEENMDQYSYLAKLESIIESIIEDKTRKTHVHSVVKKGIDQVAKKFGEESVELVIESGKNNDKDFQNEAADVLYYYLILLHERGYNLTNILKKLKKQKRKN